MKVVQVKEKIIYGISTRTTNSNEMSPKTAKIGALWQKFDNLIEVDYKNGQRVYGVYYDYESDTNGEFNVLAGYDVLNNKLELIKVEKGSYLVFNKTFNDNDNSARIQAIIETWTKVWEYFSNEDSQYKRKYKTDFEFYKEKNEIEIYISIL